MSNKVLFLIIFLMQVIMTAQKKEIVAYYPDWGPVMQGFYIKNIQAAGSASKLTVLNYAFIEPAPDSIGHIVSKFLNGYFDYQQPYTAAMSVDGVADDSTQPLRGEFNQLFKLKMMYPKLKIVLSIGGWTGSNYFSDAARTPESREIFANDCIDKFINGNLPVEIGAGGKGVAKGIFDGFDFDWEFPMEGGVEGIHHDSSDRENFTALLQLFRTKLDKIKPGYLLTAAVPAFPSVLWKFDFKKDQHILDWYNLMTYDYHGSWDTVTGHHTNLLNSQNSFLKTIKYLIDTLGVSRDKLVPGAAFYGRGWKVKNNLNYGLYRPGVTVGGIYEGGFDSYHDISSMIKKGIVYKWDDTAMAPYAYNPADSVFWTFDDPKSIALKRRCVDAYGLRGIMFWEITGDDSSGTLVNALYTGNMPEKKPGKNLLNRSMPLITITSPVTSDVITHGSDVVIKTNAEDDNSGILKVEFFCDNISLGTDTKAPFNWVWFNAPSGRHRLKAVATYNTGVKKSSGVVAVDVKDNI